MATMEQFSLMAKQEAAKPTQCVDLKPGSKEELFQEL
jgi:hypothetical protein